MTSVCNQFLDELTKLKDDDKPKAKRGRKKKRFQKNPQNRSLQFQELILRQKLDKFKEEEKEWQEAKAQFEKEGAMALPEPIPIQTKPFQLNEPPTMDANATVELMTLRVRFNSFNICRLMTFVRH